MEALRVLVRGVAIVAIVAIASLLSPTAPAKVASTTLERMVQDATFIGVIKVEKVSRGVPFLHKPRAKGAIIESWKGQTTGNIRFVAAPAFLFICDISGAVPGEDAVVFVRRHHLLHAGRGRMPIQTREGRRLADVWPEVVLPDGLKQEDGVDPRYTFIHGIDVSALRDAVSRLSKAGETSHREGPPLR